MKTTNAIFLPAAVAASGLRASAAPNPECEAQQGDGPDDDHPAHAEHLGTNQ